METSSRLHHTGLMDAGAPRRRPTLLEGLHHDTPVLALAPMQDVTDLAFWRLLAARGGPDLYWTEYFRVHATWRPEPWILRSLEENPTGRPAVAQLIGNDPAALALAARELSRQTIAAIDLNLGCPAPVVYRKCAGGGLLRDLPRVAVVLKALREATGEAGVAFTVKTRLGFADTDSFDRLLDLLSTIAPDLVTIHARTVTDGYRGAPQHEFTRRAAAALRCPVLANGDVDTPARALSTLALTRARGVMIGRACVRNPWIFSQIRATLAGRVATPHTGRDTLEYIEDLWAGSRSPEAREDQRVERMKRSMNFIGLGVGATAEESADFLWRIRRAQSRVEFFAICREFLDHDAPLPVSPWPEARPPKPFDFRAAA